MFEHLAKLVPSGTSTIDLSKHHAQLKGCKIKLRCAGKDTPRYYGAMVAAFSDRKREIKDAAGGAQLAILEEHAQVDRALYPRFIIVGWEGVLDQEGEPIECTPESRAEFCQKCPDWIWDLIRQHAMNIHHFLPVDGPKLDVDELAKNS